MMKVRNVLVCLLAMGSTWLVLQAVRPQEPPPVSPCGNYTGPPTTPCGEIGQCREYDYCKTGRVIEEILYGHCCIQGSFGRCWQYDFFAVCCKQDGQYNWKHRCKKRQEPLIALCDSTTRKCE